MYVNKYSVNFSMCGKIYSLFYNKTSVCRHINNRKIY